MFNNKKRVSYSDYFELGRSPNRKYMFLFICCKNNRKRSDISMKFIIFQDVEMNSDISDALKYTFSNDMGESWKGVTSKNNRRPTLVSNHDFFNFGLGDMKSYTRDTVYVHL